MLHARSCGTSIAKHWSDVPVLVKELKLHTSIMDSAFFLSFTGVRQRKNNNEVERLISNRWLKPLLALHLDPINVVVYHEPSGRSHLGVGFVLRCFQRLSFPQVANQPCPWQDNWHTRAASVPVLSY